MKILNFKQLRTKLLVLIYLPVCIVSLIITLYFSNIIYDNARETAKEITANKAAESGNAVKIYIEQALESSRVLRSAYEEHKANNNASRVMLEQLMKRVLENNPQYASVWAQLEYDKAYVSQFTTFTPQRLIELFGASWLRSGNEIVQDYVGEDYESYYTEDYYTVTKNSLREAVMEPYYFIYPGDKTQKNYYETSCIQPLMHNGQFFGALGVDIELSALHTLTEKALPYKGSTSGVISHKLAIAMHNDTSFISKSFVEVFGLDSVIFTSQLHKQKAFNLEVVSPKTGEKEIITISRIELGKSNTPWYYFIQVPVSEITAEARKSFILAMVIGVGGVVLLLLVLFFVSNSITDPIKKGVKFAKQISEGKLYAEFNSNSRDEIQTLAASLNNMNGKLRDIVTSMQTVSDHINQASKEILASANLTSESASEQAASIEEISTSMEQMIAGFNHNADNARITEQMASQSAKEIEAVGNAVHITIASLKTIVEKISIINDIAQKTDILAINAAIEAARAGEYGKGFAVVASEVRDLSENSQKAAQIIGELSKQTVDDAEKSRVLIDAIINKIKQTAVLVQEIALATDEQRSGASQVNLAISQMTQLSQANASSAEELAASAEVFINEAQTLKQIVSFFKLSQQKSKLSKEEFLQKINQYIKENFADDNDMSGQIAQTLAEKTEAPTAERSQISNKKSSVIKGIKLDMSDKADDEFEKM